MISKQSTNKKQINKSDGYVSIKNVLIYTLLGACFVTKVQTTFSLVPEISVRPQIRTCVFKS